jgi:hypothetical protein
MTDAKDVIASIEAAIERATDTLHNARLWESEGTYDDYIAPALSQARDHITTLTRERDALRERLDNHNEAWVALNDAYATLTRERDEARKDAARWRFFCNPQTALMLGSKYDPNDDSIDWRAEINRLADERIAALTQEDA